MNVDEVCSVENFKIIKIMDDSKPYPTMMGLEWGFENQEIINIKRWKMIFKVGYLKVTAPLDPIDGNRYIELARGTKIEKLYNMTPQMHEYVSPTTNGALSWGRIISCALDLEEGLEHWQQRMHEVSTRICAHIT
jgi:hypothetical protein